LSSGEKQVVSIALKPSAFAYYDPSQRLWVVDKGAYEILVGSSSRDIRLRQTVEIPNKMIIQD
jgi:beta-glucosidase